MHEEVDRALSLDTPFSRCPPWDSGAILLDQGCKHKVRRGRIENIQIDYGSLHCKGKRADVRHDINWAYYDNTCSTFYGKDHDSRCSMLDIPGYTLLLGQKYMHLRTCIRTESFATPNGNSWAKTVISHARRGTTTIGHSGTGKGQDRSDAYIANRHLQEEPKIPTCSVE
jgi:hypothetical protein